MTKKARLDSDGIAKGKTRIVSHAREGDCIGPHSRLNRPEYEAEDGTRIPLDSFNDNYEAALQAIIKLVQENKMDPDRICAQLALSAKLVLNL